MPTVSVIIPAYNHCQYITDAIESVTSQTFRDHEIIVVNDGSPDTTADVLRPYVERGIIQYVHQINSGQAAARNRGLELARGEFVLFHDDDDVSPPDRLEWQVECLIREPNVIFAYGYAVNLATGSLHSPLPEHAPDGDVRHEFVGGTWLSSPGQGLFRSSVLRSVGGFDASMRGTDDWDLYLRLRNVGFFRFVNRCALRYRVHETNASNDQSAMRRNALRVIHKHFPWRLNRKDFLLAWKARHCYASIQSAGFVARASAKSQCNQSGAVKDLIQSFVVAPWTVLKRSHWKQCWRALYSPNR